MKLSIVIPAYNEVNTLPEVIRRTHALAVDKEILVVDDGSTDGTAELLKSVELPDLKAFFHPANRGKGASLRTAFQHVT
ncbi:MAG: glycosyltransferase family 2 protein, partial [Deltaproteobacteria bacterium]|nr:glycosyltransferase family 2 protein [Deltaproteobacteria bacterium]